MLAKFRVLCYDKGRTSTPGFGCCAVIKIELMNSFRVLCLDGDSPDTYRISFKIWRMLMIALVRGTLLSKEEDCVVVEAGQVGLEIRVPLPVLEALPPLGEEVKLYTYFQVREDGMSLYGFLTPQDKRIFKQLLAVNGVGPKAALAVLSAVSLEDLRIALVSEDAKAIARAPGIGLKTARRIILDMKDKISVDQLTESWMAANRAGKDDEAAEAGLAGAAKEAVQALVALGYSNVEAAKAVKKVELAEGMSAEDVLKASLKFLAFM